jgi:hypothetical protein
MCSEYGNTLHILCNKNGRESSMPRSTEWIDVKVPQRIFDTRNANAEQWRKLCKGIFNSIIKSHTGNGR